MKVGDLVRFVGHESEKGVITKVIEPAPENQHMRRYAVVFFSGLSLNDLVYFEIEVIS